MQFRAYFIQLLQSLESAAQCISPFGWKSLMSFESMSAKRYSFQACLCVLSALLFGVGAVLGAPVVSNLVAVQRVGTKLIDITYDVSVSGLSSVLVSLEISSDGGVTWQVPVSSAVGDVGSAVVPGTGKAIVWNAKADWPGNYTSQMRFRVKADGGFAFIPSGTFIMGRSSGDLDGNSPTVTVNVSEFYLQATEVTWAEWSEVRTWGINNGYTDISVGAGKGADHPVHSVSWWDVIKWCNAQSEMSGLVPCYTISGVVMKTGTTVPTVNWSANGYRLPTEAEWEKAARGGVGGKRFPWGTDNISHVQANFDNSGGETYQSGAGGYHPSFTVGAQPYTSPVGTFTANDYGMKDMSGNVWEWCWDWYGSSYYTNGVTDPRGPSSGVTRTLRGGSWASFATYSRNSSRGSELPGSQTQFYGFRPARARIDDSSTASTVNVSVDSRNTAPAISNITDRSIGQDTTTGEIGFTISDDDTLPGQLLVSASVDNEQVVSSSGIVLGGSSANRTIRVTPVIGMSGAVTVTVAVSDGELTASKSFVLTILATKPLFAITPEGGTQVNPGTSVTFNANYVDGIQPFTFRWRRNGSFISGANASSFTISVVSKSHAGIYDCIVTNAYGSFVTPTSVLAVNDPVVITTSPLSQSANIGQEVTFKVRAIGTAPLEYQWRKNGTPIPGENSSTLVLSVEAGSGGFYDVVVDNALSSVTSSNAALIVLRPPVITEQPIDQNLTLGSTAIFSVTAVGPALTYQWRKNGINMSGQTGTVLMIPNANRTHEGIYDVIVKNSSGTVLSDPVWLSLPQLLQITEQPQDVTALAGDVAEFSVLADGPGVLAYQWNKDGKPIKDARARTLNVQAINPAVAGIYTVTVSSGSLKVTSQPAYLRVPDAGLLIYKFTLTGNYFVGTGSAKIALSGLLILDRLNQRGGIIRYAKNGKLDTFFSEVDDELNIHSTGPVSNSQTLVSKVLQGGGPLSEDVAMLWLRGADSEVVFSTADRTIAPKTLAGFQTELRAADRSEVGSMSMNATLDMAASLQARQAGETVEQTLNRLSASLQQKGYVRE